MSKRSQFLVFIFLLLATFSLYLYNVQQHCFLGDDAFISFRYSKHLTLGHGLVWNVGERVEGYTNFLWVLLIALGMHFSFEPEWFSLVLSVASGIVVWWLFLVWALRRHGLLGFSLWFPLIVLSLSRSFTGWATGGLETMFFTMLTFAGALAVVHSRKHMEVTPVWSALLFAAATLTRPDGIVFAFVAGLVLLFDSIRGKRSLLAVFSWTALYFLPVGLHVLWRYHYYGFLLPNTFYAKVHGLWLEQALNYFALFERYYHFAYCLPFVLLAVCSKRRYEARYFLLLLTVYASYIVYVGGDRFEFRFLVVIFPYLYWLLAEGIVIACRSLLGLFLQRSLQQVVMASIAASVLYNTWLGSNKEVPKPERSGISSIRGIEKYATSRTEQGLFLQRLIAEGYYPDDLPLALGGAGAVPYYSMLPVLDRRGLNSVEIAHMPIENRGRIAHEHDAPWEFLAERKIPVFDILNRIYHKTLYRLNVKKYYHDGHRARMRALKTPYGYIVFATFVSDEELRALFPRLELIKPDWEQREATQP